MKEEDTGLEKEEIVYIQSSKQLVELVEAMEEGQVITILFQTPEEGEVYGKKE